MAPPTHTTITWPPTLLGSSAPTLVSTGLFLLVSLVLIATNKTLQTWLLEALKTRRDVVMTDGGAKDMMARFAKNKHEVYTIPMPYDPAMVVLPPSTIDSIKGLPETTCNFVGALQDMLCCKYTGAGLDIDIVNVSMRTGFNKGINKVMVDIHEETQWAMAQELPEASKDGWQPWVPFAHCQRIIALITGRIFIGSELNREPDYMASTVNFSTNSLIATNELLQYHPLLQPLVAPFIPALAATRQDVKQLERLLQSVFEERLRRLGTGEEIPEDMISWNLVNTQKRFRSSVHRAAIQQLAASQAAIHTTSMQLINTLHDLAAYPEYQEPIRAEFEAVLAGKDGPISVKDMARMHKLDSFMREVQRMKAAGAGTMMRKWYKDFTLPDGTRIKKGAHTICAAVAASYDPESWENPREFDGLRFEKLRQQPGCENMYHFITTGIDNFHFGHGNHSCPGRWFASYEVKSVIVHLLRMYDMKLPDGQKRPEQLVTGSFYSPSPTQEVLLKRRS